MSNSQFYIITAIDKRTGERVPVTKPHKYEKAYNLLLSAQSGKSGTFFKVKTYKYPKMETYKK